MNQQPPQWIAPATGLMREDEKRQLAEMIHEGDEDAIEEDIEGVNEPEQPPANQAKDSSKVEERCCCGQVYRFFYLEIRHCNYLSVSNSACISCWSNCHDLS